MGEKVIATGPCTSAVLARSFARRFVLDAFFPTIHGSSCCGMTHPVELFRKTLDPVGDHTAAQCTHCTTRPTRTLNASPTRHCTRVLCTSVAQKPERFEHFSCYHTQINLESTTGATALLAGSSFKRRSGNLMVLPYFLHMYTTKNNCSTHGMGGWGAAYRCLLLISLVGGYCSAFPVEWW